MQYRRGRVAIFQEATTGNGWLLTGELDVRPVPTVRVALTGTVFRLDRLDGREFARSTIPRLKIEYQPQRELFFRAIGEYRSERRGGAGGPGHRRAALRRRRGAAAHGVQRPPGRSAGVVRADAGDRGVPGLRQLARDRRRVQLVAAGADDRRVLREAGVSDQPVAAALDPRLWAGDDVPAVIALRSPSPVPPSARSGLLPGFARPPPARRRSGRRW